MFVFISLIRFLCISDWPQKLYVAKDDLEAAEDEFEILISCFQL